MKKGALAEQLFYWVSIGAVACGVLLWLMTIDSKASAGVQGVAEIRARTQEDQKQNQTQLEDIRARLIRIEDKLDR